MDYTLTVITELEAPKKDQLDETVYVLWEKVPMDVTGGDGHRYPMSRSDAFYHQVILNHRLHDSLEYFTSFDVSYINKKGKEKYKTNKYHYLTPHIEDNILMDEFDRLDKTHVIISSIADKYEGHAYLCFPKKDRSVCLFYGFRDRVDNDFLGNQARYVGDDIITAATIFARKQGCNKLAFAPLYKMMKPQPSTPMTFNKSIFDRTGCDYIRFLRPEEELILDVVALE